MKRSALHVRSRSVTLIFAFAITILCLSESFGQGVAVPVAEPSRPGVGGFHSNLGLQEIVEVGVPLRETVPAPTVTPVPVAPPRPVATLPEPVAPSLPAPPQPLASSSGEPLINASVSSGMRLYHTSNVLRTKGNESGSGVYEFNVGAGLGTRAARLGEYVTFLPRIDFMTQWAKYGEKTVQDLLEYQYSMIKGSAAIGLPDEWSLGFGFEYNYLGSLSTGDRMFDATAPTFSIQKIVPFSENSFLMIDSMLKYANTDRVIPDAIKQAQAAALGVNNVSPFLSEGVFADDGDNLQTGLNFTYIRTFGPEGRLLFMPNLGFTRTSYKKNDHSGRVDYLFTLGASGIYQWKDWLGFQTFLNYSKMFTNKKGQGLLGESAKFRAWDIGVALTGNYRF